jgi:hypothetical protein
MSHPGIEGLETRVPEQSAAQALAARPPRRWQRKGIIAIAAVALTIPFAFARPADAAVIQDQVQESLTFVTFSGATVTCTLSALNEHDRDGQDADGIQDSKRSDGAPVPECRGNHVMVMTYKDEEGDENTVTTGTVDTAYLSMFVQGVQGSIRITHSVVFPACDPESSATCFLSVAASPQ